jgi:hypothetical protein
VTGRCNALLARSTALRTRLEASARLRTRPPCSNITPCSTC